MKGRAAAWAPLLLALGVVAVLFGGRSCVKEPDPPLLRLADVVPRDVEVGDRVAVLGADFPPGRAARVTFRGTLHRPGERPIRAAEIVACAVATSPQRLELPFDEATQALFAGAARHATHTTFEGDIEVAFPGASPGAAPVTGRLAHVTFDVRPGPGVARRLEESGEAVIAWLGIKARAGGSGLVVEEVEPGSRARAWGIAEGDVVTSFDGVRVAAPSDMVPPPDEQTATVGLRRGGGEDVTRSLPLLGLPRPPAAEFLAPVATVGTTLFAVFLLGVPSTPLAPWLLGIMGRARDRRRHGGLWLPARSDSLTRAGFALIVDILAYASLAVMPFGQYLIAARLDVGILFVIAVASLGLAAFMAAGSTWAGMRASMQVVWRHAPAGFAIASVVAATGSLRIQEINDAQGACPWQWLAFRQPGALLALGLLLASCHVSPDIVSPDLARPPSREKGDGAARSATGRRGPWFGAACRAHSVLVAGLASSLFLGGWHLPGPVDADRYAQPVLEVAEAAWLMSKTYALAWIVASTRSLLGSGHVGEGRATSYWQLPLGAMALVASIAWARWSPTPAAQQLMSALLAGMSALAAAAVLLWTRRSATSAVADRHVSPIL